MSGILDLITSQLSGGLADQIGSSVGADSGGTQKAIAAALPALLGGLARNANKSPDGANALAAALDRDHDGSLLDSLPQLLSAAGGISALFGGQKSTSGGGGLGALLGAAGSLFGGQKPQVAEKAVDGSGILRHVLGNRQTAVEQGVAKASGLDLSKVAQLLPALAPIVMGALGKVKRQQNLDAGGLAGLLSKESSTLEAAAPGMKAGGLLGLLDTDNDGDIVDDLAKIGTALGGSALLGKLFGGK